tara:strand:+ start:26 stop:208 length:183 start_codon:yes stop_codon:yes gene_type:complete
MLLKMKIRVKVMMTLDIDPEEYPVPADGRVDEEIQDHMQDYIHDLSGVKIKHMRAISEEI